MNNYYDPNNPQAYAQAMQNNAAYLAAVKASHDAGRAMLQEAIQYATLETKNQQLAILHNKEVAYSSVVEHGGGLAVPGQTGTLKQLYKTGVAEVIYIIVDPLFQQENFYMVRANNGKTFCFPESFMINDRKFLGGMALLLGKPANIYTTGKKVAELVREYLIARARTVAHPYYSGWDIQDNNWFFRLRDNSTHAPQIPSTPEQIPQEIVFTDISKANTLAAAERIADMFQRFDENESNVLFLWWHLSFLHTILYSNRLVPAMGLCICSQGPLSKLCLEKIFCWFGDETISLGCSLDQLRRMMIDRKDEPLILSDRNHKSGNCEFVHQVITEGQIPLKAGSELYTPLNSFVTLLSNGTSPLCCKNTFFTLEMDDNSWCDCDPSTIEALSGYIADYLRGFASYVQDHVDLLLNCLKEGNKGLNRYCLEGMTPEAFTTFTTLRGLRFFLRNWQKHLALNEQQAKPWNTFLQENNDFLVQLLNASSTVDDNLSSIFITVSKRMVEKGEIAKVSADYAPTTCEIKSTTGGTIYANSECWYFDRDAFSNVCRQCDAGTTTMVKSLSANRFLSGPIASASTYMTRISVHDTDGDTHNLRVYAFEKKLFEDTISDFDYMEDEK